MKRKDRVHSTGADWDVFTRWRYWLCWCSNPGATAWWKRNYRRRCRKQAKENIRDGANDI